MPFLPPVSVERALVSVALLPGPPPCGSSLWEGGNTSTQSRGKRAKGQDKPGLSASLGLQDKEGLAESEQDRGRHHRLRDFKVPSPVLWMGRGHDLVANLGGAYRYGLDGG